MLPIAPKFSTVQSGIMLVQKD